MPRLEPLTTGEIYHVMSKSIAGYKIFNSARDYIRMQQMLHYFSIAERLPKFSQLRERNYLRKHGIEKYLQENFKDAKRHVEIIAYCLMPTHIHLAVRQLHYGGISTFMSNLLNSYTRYLNTKYKRKGPLWVSRFKSVHVKTDEQLLHLTRYLHLNPFTAGLINKTENWNWSSYQEYIKPDKIEHPLCHFHELIDMKPKKYRAFVNDHADYQRVLAKIKKLALE